MNRTPHDRTATEPLARASYIGSTTEELARKRRGDLIAAAVDQKTLFPRRGKVALRSEHLVLEGWHDGGDLVLRRADITSIANEFTELYGRFLGGLLNAGKPLILGTTVAGEIYLMIDHKSFLETTSNRKWTRLLNTWLHSND
ncbi:hypothetical protein AB0J35_35000 [Nonomuraea angiospora]|uniref:hypothetical protein n=1 Tax=Nonomuraea angiospora TaxID=46172 RepID=UPI003435CEB3